MYEARLAAIVIAVREGEHDFADHALDQMRIRQISVATLETALCDGDPEVIEDYPDDPRGTSCLVRCIAATGRVLHVHVTYPPYPRIVTAYWPDSQPEKWDAGFRRRASR